MRKTFQAANRRIAILAVSALAILGMNHMAAITLIGMNSDGQFMISQPGDIFDVLATVANSGSYADLADKPSIPSAQVNSDWSASSGISQMLNKPSLAAVALSGAYGDLSGTPTIPSVVRTTSSLSLSLVGTGAVGTQISGTKDSTIRCGVSTSTTSTIGGASTSLVSLKICSTNNVTEGSWTTIATLENDQTITLAIALQSLQIIKGQLCADVPAGWYAKLVNSGTGTHSEVSIGGQQTIYG